MSSSGIDKVLILTEDSGRNAVIENLVVNGLKHPHAIQTAHIGKEGLSLVKKGDFGLLIISSNILNSDSIKAASLATNHPTATIIYIAAESSFENEEEKRNKAELLELGATYLSKPLTKNAFLVALNSADMAHIRLCTLRQKLENEKVINRAKLVLMEVLCMTEEQAHKYIEKESMNHGVTKVETAYDVLRTYDY